MNSMFNFIKKVIKAYFNECAKMYTNIGCIPF